MFKAKEDNQHKKWKMEKIIKILHTKKSHKEKDDPKMIITINNKNGYTQQY